MVFLLLLKIIYRLNNLHPQFHDMLFYEDKLDCMLYNNNYTFLSFFSYISHQSYTSHALV